MDKISQIGIGTQDRIRHLYKKVNTWGKENTDRDLDWDSLTLDVGGLQRIAAAYCMKIEYLLNDAEVKVAAYADRGCDEAQILVVHSGALGFSTFTKLMEIRNTLTPL
jgi:hypothetical protein